MCMCTCLGHHETEVSLHGVLHVHVHAALSGNGANLVWTMPMYMQVCIMYIVILLGECTALWGSSDRALLAQQPSPRLVLAAGATLAVLLCTIS